jgi:pimeloyl-ACP methyl ester carboxylesterase
MAVIENGGTRIEVVQVGRGRELVALHSLLTDRSAFDRILPQLARHYRVTLLSLPGFGASSPVRPGIWNYVDWVSEAFDMLGLTPEADVLGNGFGGSVALAFAAKHGNRLRRLVLADAVASFPAEARGAFRDMAAKVKLGGMEAILEVAVRRLFTDDYIQTHPHLLDACRSVLLRMEPQAFIAACETLAGLNMVATDIVKSALVIVGEHDTATPAPLCRALAESLPRGVYREIPDCAHAPQIQKPEIFLELVESFLAQADETIDQAHP